MLVRAIVMIVPSCSLLFGIALQAVWKALHIQGQAMAVCNPTGLLCAPVSLLTACTHAWLQQIKLIDEPYHLPARRSLRNQHTQDIRTLCGIATPH